MSKSRPRDHTVLPRAHLRDYFEGQGFQTYDLQDREWKSWGPRTFGTIRGYYEHEIEDELGKIESNALPAVRKLAERRILDDKERQHVAWYIAASLFRNSTMFDELLPEVLENFKQDLFPDGVTEIPDLVRHEVDVYVDEATSDEEFRRGMHGAWFEHAEQFPLIAQNIYDLSWHILYVARKPNYLLLTDRPFCVHAPTDPTEAALTFPISSQVMLLVNREPDTRWLVQPMERDFIIKYGRMLVKRAKRFIAAPYEDPNLTRMIGRVRDSKSNLAARYVV